MLLLVLIPRYQHLFCISAHLAQRLLWEKLVSQEVLRLSYLLKTFFVNWFRCFLWFWLFWSFNNRRSPVFGCFSFVHPEIFAKLLTGEMLRKLVTWLSGAFVISFPFCYSGFESQLCLKVSIAFLHWALQFFLLLKSNYFQTQNSFSPGVFENIEVMMVLVLSRCEAVPN